METPSFIIKILSYLRIEDYIQISIIIVLFSTIVLSFFTYRGNKKQNEINLFTLLVKEFRQINMGSRTTEQIIFNFYEYLAVLLFRKHLDFNLFYDYFNFSIGQVYIKFMASEKYNCLENRVLTYPYLSKLFNIFGLSIQEINLPSTLSKSNKKKAKQQ